MEQLHGKRVLPGVSVSGVLHTYVSTVHMVQYGLSTDSGIAEDQQLLSFQ